MALFTSLLIFNANLPSGLRYSELISTAFSNFSYSLLSSVQALS